MNIAFLIARAYLCLLLEGANVNVQAENCSVKSIRSGYRLENDMVMNTMICHSLSWDGVLGLPFRVGVYFQGLVLWFGFGFRVSLLGE